MPGRSGRGQQPSPTGKRRTNKERGVGWQHTQNRERLLARHRDGRPCWWCGRPLHRDPARNFDGHPLEADHSRSRSRHGNRGNAADRLLHKTCNIQRGDGSRDQERPAAVHVVADTTSTDLGPLAMPWPDFDR